jgi:hypothetical protein
MLWNYTITIEKNKNKWSTHMLNYIISVWTEEQVKYKKSHSSVNMACIWIDYNKIRCLPVTWGTMKTVTCCFSDWHQWQCSKHLVGKSTDNSAHGILNKITVMPHITITSFKNHTTLPHHYLTYVHTDLHTQFIHIQVFFKIHRFQTEVFIAYAYFTKQESKQNLKQMKMYTHQHPHNY